MNEPIFVVPENAPYDRPTSNVMERNLKALDIIYRSGGVDGA